MQKSMKRIAVLLVIALLVPMILPCVPLMKGLSSSDVYAASKAASLMKTKATIGVVSSPEYILINNRNEKASYTFSSKNKKIATVDKYGYITGVKKGSTTITVSEKYKGKVKKVGTYSIKVVGAGLNTKEISIGVSSESYIMNMVTYRNFKAKYTFKSSDSSTVSVDQYGTVHGYKFGSADISISEVYKSKTTKLGTIKVTVKEIELTNFNFYKDDLDTVDNLPTIKCPLGDEYSVRYYFDKEPYDASAPITYSSDNTAIATIDDFGHINPVSEGTTNVTVSCGTFSYKIQVIVTKASDVVEEDIDEEDF